MKYGIEKGQRYQGVTPGNIVEVIDVETYAFCDDVVVKNAEGDEYRIDAFKLAMVRYSLIKE